MTIQFNCPNCDALIAFPDKHASKRARCLTCGQILIIPSKDSEKPKKIKPRPGRTEPLPGFYHAVFIDSWKIFFDPENLTPLAVVATLVCLKFFLASGFCFLNYISFVVAWGFLLGFYLNIIYETAFEIDALPEISFGETIDFVWFIIRPFFIFFLTMLVVQLPFIIALALLKNKGIIYENLWQALMGPHLHLKLLFILGLFIFPATILTVAVGKDITLLRPDYIITAILKAPLSYLIVITLLVAASLLEMHTKQFSGPTAETFFSTAAKLAVNLAVQILAIIAMRSIGLFYRHYSCYLKW